MKKSFKICSKILSIKTQGHNSNKIIRYKINYFKILYEKDDELIEIERNFKERIVGVYFLFKA